ncbi:efflux RND transporter periplasmic adaptor subunit [Limnochorda pilosa]|uniref:CzcB-like barrel-sandwich hybrid domain-containing protein n=1 Tax=Limnochorda pilosa TaxID=1555112 RepID=A0A0K2SP20_LIMPI|nr:HlyD family efflux transporter periplasmic adaptor subunit [Limnochorda pilosa]BAS28574.1 hypothetical protein LIP_2744 [Limnochorda pilosa]
MPTGDQPRYDRPIFEGGQESSRPDPGRASGPRRRRVRLGHQGRLLLFTVAFLAVLVSAAYFALRPQAEEVYLDSYQVAEVGVRAFRVLVQGDGAVEPAEIRALTAPLEARVSEVHARPGDDVNAGALLVRLESRELEDDLASARSSAAQLELELQRAEISLTRDLERLEADLSRAASSRQEAEAAVGKTEALFEAGAIPLDQVEEARSKAADARTAETQAERALATGREDARLQRELARAKLASARAEVARLEREAAALEVRAPLSGRVLEGEWTVGEPVEAGVELFRLADLSTQYARIQVPARQASQLRVGQEASLFVEGRRLAGTVGFVAPVARQTEQGTVVEVRVSLPDEATARSIRPFAPLSAEVEVDRLEDQPYLARGPFYTSGEGGFVFKVSEDGTRAVRTEVRYGLVDGTALQILDGLEPGDRIIYSSYTGFRDRTEVRLAPEGGRPT